MATASHPTSFSKSFSRGALFTIALLFVFCGWAYLNGSSYKEQVFETLPIVSVPVRTIEQDVTISPNTTLNTEQQNTVIEEPETIPQNSVQQTELYQEDLVENSQFGLIPKPDISKNLTPFDAYKRNFILPSGQRKFQLILGPFTFLDDTVKQVADQLPQDVSILISPYSPNPEALLTLFKNSGHEVWVELPIEVYNPAIDTGTLSLRADYSGNKNMSVYKRVLGSMTGYVGLFLDNADNVTLSFSSARSEQLQNDLYQRGLGLAYSSSVTFNYLEKIASSNDGQIRRLKENENALSSRKISVWNDALEKNQNMSVFYTPTPQDIPVLKEWFETLPEKGYVLAPISASQE